MFCGNCGAQLQEGWLACPSCGTPRRDASGQPRRLTRSRLLTIGAILAVLLIVVGVVLSSDSSKPDATKHGGRSATASSGAGAPDASSRAAGSGADLSNKSGAINGGTGSGGHQATSTSEQQGSAPSPAAPSLAFDGSGSRTTSPFNIRGGLTVFRFACARCTGNFVVRLIDAEGKTVDVIVNASGGYNGSVGRSVQEGSYRMKVEASATWHGSAAQPRNENGSKLPVTYKGPGQQFVGPFAADNDIHLIAHNKGSSNFVVQVLSANGRTLAIPFNKNGDFDGSADAHRLSGAPYYLNVDSDGTWSIEVSRP